MELTMNGDEGGLHVDRLQWQQRLWAAEGRYTVGCSAKRFSLSYSLLARALKAREESNHRQCDQQNLNCI